METYQNPISVLEPVGDALGRTKLLLFKPFNLEKWFLIGFCAWIANFLSNGGGFPLNWSGGGDGQAGQEIGKATEVIKENIILFGVLGSIIALVVITIMIVLLWLSSRGHFMFVDCLAKNKGQVVDPWKNYKQQGNSLFWFRLILGIASTFIIALFIVPFIFIALAFKSHSLTLAALIGLMVLFGLFMVLAGIFLGIVRLLTIDFVVPIMYVQKIKVMEAWRRYFHILGQHFWKTVLYCLFKMVIIIAVGIIMLVVKIFACCCLCGIGILLFIPYLGTVIYLPFFSFLRLYPLCFLKQFGSEYDVFVNN
jgi:hypothetical protein